MDDGLLALDSAYGGLSRLAAELTPADAWRPTRCTGWVVRDLLFHLLSDTWRALTALGTPTTDPVDTDATSYWLGFPGGFDPASRELQSVRVAAGTWEPQALAQAYAEASGAVLVLARRSRGTDTVRTQGHVLTVDDLLGTLTVEATLHHLDLTLDLDTDGPSPFALATTRRTLDALFGRPSPPGWSDERWSLVASGREPPTPAERAELGADAGRLPVLG